MRIADRLFVSEKDAIRSKEIVKELKKMESEFPKIAKVEAEKKEKYWIAHEALRKAETIGCRPEEYSKLRRSVEQAKFEITVDRVALNERSKVLVDELNALTIPVIKDAVVLLERELGEVRALKSARTINSRTQMKDRGNRGETDIKIRTIQHNFKAIDEVVELINSFISKVKSMTGISLDQIK